MAIYSGTNARICPRCFRQNSRVYNVRNEHELIKRYRICKDCGFKWSTVEIEFYRYKRLIENRKER